MESRRPRVLGSEANWRVWVLEMLGTERKWRDAMRLGSGNITWHQFHGLRDKRIKMACLGQQKTSGGPTIWRV
jgi:hypothetical protein